MYADTAGMGSDGADTARRAAAALWVCADCDRSLSGRRVEQLFRRDWRTPALQHRGQYLDVSRDRTYADLPVSFGRYLLLPALPEFTRRYPLIELDLRLNDRIVDLVLWTHKIGGLHENDFILAAKIQKLLDESPETATAG